MPGTIRVLWDYDATASVTIRSSSGTVSGGFTVNGSPVAFPYSLTADTSFVTTGHDVFSISVLLDGVEIAATPDGVRSVDLSGPGAPQLIFSPGLDSPVAADRALLEVHDIRTYGAAVDGVTDDTAAWTAAFAALGTSPGVITMPAGESICGPDVIVLNTKQGIAGAGRGKSKLRLKSGAASSRLIRTRDWSTLRGTQSHSGPYGFSITGLTIDGGADDGVTMRPLGTVPGAPTLGATTGTLAAGTYAYRIRGVYGEGETQHGPWTQITLGGTGGVTVSWSAMTGVTGYRVYGRSSAQSDGSYLLLADIAAGTTTWTDDGSVTPTVKRSKAFDTSGGATVAVYGHSFLIDDVDVHRSPGIGLLCEAGPSSPTENDTGDVQMEARLGIVRTTRCYGSGFVFVGPHDSHAHSIFAAQNARTAVSTLDNVVLADGPLDIDQIHAWGQARYAIAALGSGMIRSMRAEGAMTADLFVYGNEFEVDGEVFSPGSATTKGVVVGDSQFSPSGVRLDIRARQFSSSSGAAFDLTYCGSRIVADLASDQSTGTVYVPPTTVAATQAIRMQQDNTWIPLTLSGFTARSGHGVPSYRREGDLIRLKGGMVASGAYTGGTTFATLPAGYRPAQQRQPTIKTQTSASNLFIDTTGTISVTGSVTDTQWVELDGITFTLT